MTVHHFIASLKELSTGDFGMRPKIKPQIEPQIEEAYGISVFEADGYESLLKRKFTNLYRSEEDYYTSRTGLTGGDGLTLL